MGNVLRNPRHELYAQGIVAGLTRTEAFKHAGYTGKSSSQGAFRLHALPHIQRRIKELMELLSRKSELSRRDILDRIFQDWELARKLGQVPAALKAAELMGKEMHKMFGERKEIGGAGDFDNKTEDELVESAKQKAKRLGLSVLRDDVA